MQATVPPAPDLRSRLYQSEGERLREANRVLRDALAECLARSSDDEAARRTRRALALGSLF